MRLQSLLQTMLLQRMPFVPLLIAASLLAGCAAFTHTPAAVPSKDFLAVQELRDTSYFQFRSIGAPFSGTYYDARDSAYSTVIIDPVYAHALNVDDLRAGDSLGVYNGSFLQAEKQVLASAYKIIGATHQ
jgi:hypothetical protein